MSYNGNDNTGHVITISTDIGTIHMELVLSQLYMWWQIRVTIETELCCSYGKHIRSIMIILYYYTHTMYIPDQQNPAFHKCCVCVCKREETSQICICHTSRNHILARAILV